MTGPHGRAKVSVTRPQAFAVCDRCGFLYNHVDLQWQYDWRGPNLANLRKLVCESCLDKPQENGQRTFILPPDPVAIRNARPEFYIADDSPLSAIGANASPTLWRFSAQIGSLTGGAGVPAAFDSNTNKPSWQCANLSISQSSYNNYVGINWGGDVSGITTPSSLMAPVITHVVSSFTATAPNNQSFLGTTPTDWVFQGSPVNTSLYGAWTTLSSGTTAGTAGETISASPTGGSYQFHRLAFLGDQINLVALAQLEITVSDEGSFTT